MYNLLELVQSNIKSNEQRLNALENEKKSLHEYIQKLNERINYLIDQVKILFVSHT